MKSLTALFAALAFLVSLPSHAGVAEKKAIRVLTAEIETATAGVKTACDNAELTSTIIVDEKFMAQQINIAKSNVRDFFAGMLAVCKDADYREEISKLQQLDFSLTDDDNKTGNKTTIYGEIKLASETMLQIALHVRISLSNGSSATVPNVIKELY